MNRSRNFTIFITYTLLLLMVEAPCCTTASRSIESEQSAQPLSERIKPSLVRLQALSSASLVARLHLRL